MYRIVVILILSIFCINARSISDSEAKIVEFINKNDGLGNYHFRFETSEGMIREETGRRVNIGKADEHVAVQGFYSYPDPDGVADGVIHSVHYRADKNGYIIFDPLAEGVRISETLVASLLG